jgi:hypothetical protein
MTHGACKERIGLSLHGVQQVQKQRPVSKEFRSQYPGPRICARLASQVKRQQKSGYLANKSVQAW